MLGSFSSQKNVLINRFHQFQFVCTDGFWWEPFDLVDEVFREMDLARGRSRLFACSDKVAQAKKAS